jgi:hypothetical protein
MSGFRIKKVNEKYIGREILNSVLDEYGSSLTFDNYLVVTRLKEALAR